MNRFKVIKCEKKSYKPSYDNYLNALIRVYERFLENPERLFNNEKDKMMYLLIKIIGLRSANIRNMSEEQIRDMYGKVELVNGIIAQHTPNEFMQMFPISKTYDGEKSGCKDYFYCMENIEKKGIEEPIGEDVLSFLWDYVNFDINFYLVGVTGIISAMSTISGGSDPFLDFLSDEGIPTYTHYENEGIMIKNSTEKVVKVRKTKKRIPKYLKVVGEE